MKRVLALSSSVCCSLALLYSSPALAQPPIDTDPSATSTCWMVDDSGQFIDLMIMCDGLTGLAGSNQEITVTHADGSTTTMPANNGGGASTAALSETGFPPQSDSVSVNEGLESSPWLDALWIIESGGVDTNYPIVSFPSNGSSSSGGGSSSSSGGSGSGNCNSPGDTAADGSSCGGRAASERPGGR